MAANPNGSQERQRKNKFSWYLKAPIRALGRVKDLYINNMIRCADNRNFGGVYPAGMAMSRNSSVHTHTSDQDYAELVRAASQKKLAPDVPPSGVVPRSQSVAAFGRIDEDRPMEFAGDAVVGVPLYPRSRSAVPISRNQRMR
ncbi:hypothetical protein ZOSMA_9G01300 [Zostera marina]|uniref:Uncharacterized protein n=1 Tax=Zostera marina TaxID=29655 RepID=A0A0K9NGY0_ZOSMR|nr:hypothetical protein ZOSMA_9G01300 [Zostera marina]